MHKSDETSTGTSSGEAAVSHVGRRGVRLVRDREGLGAAPSQKKLAGMQSCMLWLNMPVIPDSEPCWVGDGWNSAASSAGVSSEDAQSLNWDEQSEIENSGHSVDSKASADDAGSADCSNGSEQSLIPEASVWRSTRGGEENESSVDSKSHMFEAKIAVSESSCCDSAVGEFACFGQVVGGAFGLDGC